MSHPDLVRGGVPPSSQPPPPLPTCGLATINAYPCMWCDAAPVVTMKVPTNGREVSAFCSQQCAAEYAVDLLDGSDLTWCLAHQCWTDELGQCPICQNVRFVPLSIFVAPGEEGSGA